jgi:hypothetical protein
MDRIEKDPEREERIEMEAIVDAYGSEEQAMGWYYYLQDKIAFPFQGRCIVETRISPLKKGETTQVIALAPEEDCMCTMSVIVEWHGREMGIKLEQIEAVEIDDESEEAISDWHYWINRGYQIC